MQHQCSEAILLMKSTCILPSTVGDGCLSGWNFSSWIHVCALLKGQWLRSERIMLGRLFDFEVRVTYMPSKHINIMCKMLPPKEECRWPGFLKPARKKKEIQLQLLGQHSPASTVSKVTGTWWRYVSISVGWANSALHLSSVWIFNSLQFAAGLYLADLCVTKVCKAPCRWAWLGASVPRNPFLSSSEIFKTLTSATYRILTKEPEIDKKKF